MKNQHSRSAAQVADHADHTANKLDEILAQGSGPEYEALVTLIVDNGIGPDTVLPSDPQIAEA